MFLFFPLCKIIFRLLLSFVCWLYACVKNVRRRWIYPLVSRDGRFSELCGDLWGIAVLRLFFLRRLMFLTCCIDDITKPKIHLQYFYLIFVVWLFFEITKTLWNQNFELYASVHLKSAWNGRTPYFLNAYSKLFSCHFKKKNSLIKM